MTGYEFGDFIAHYEGREDGAPPWGHFFGTMGYSATYPEAGVAEVTWPDPSPYSFPGPQGHDLIHGGMLATLADTAMGHATFTLLGADESFLTGDLRIDFMRAAPVQPLVGIGRVERRTRRIYHCSAQLLDLDRTTVFAESRCVQVIL